MRLSAAASASIRSVLAGPAQPATWLGAAPAALYVQVAAEPGVLALLAHDAVRLPFGLVLPTTTADLPLTSLVPRGSAPILGAGELTWTGAAGPIVVRAVREWAPARARRGTIAPSALAAVLAALPAPASRGIDGACLHLLTGDPAAAAARLLGRGPGLTPAGDDVLAGFLAGGTAFGLDTAGLRAATEALAPVRTTALSAALLRCAVRGECIDELAAVAAALTGGGRPEPAVGRLLRVGHTSGAALATGMVTAAAAALSADGGATGVAA